jgi:hypothetical protein
MANCTRAKRSKCRITLHHSNPRDWHSAINPNHNFTCHRPLQDYLNLAIQNGFVLDGFAEGAFPPDHPQFSTLGWGGKFSEIPVVIAHLRLPSFA